MKNFKTLKGLALSALAAALYVSGPVVQEQVDQLAASENVQLAKALYQSVDNESAPLKATTVLAENHEAAPMQFDSAKASTAVAAKAKCVKAVRPPAPPAAPAAQRLEQVAFVMPPQVPRAGLSAAEVENLRAQIENTNLRILSSLNKMDMKRVVMVHTDGKGERVRVEVKSL
jgi:hypothetical protein